MHLVHFAGGQIVVSGECDVQETLVVAEVEIHLQIDNLRTQAQSLMPHVCPVSSLENTMQVMQADRVLRASPRRHHLEQTLHHARKGTWSPHLC